MSHPAKCVYCPNPAEPDDLCAPCSVELAHRIMDAEPEREFCVCYVCKAQFRYVEARVLRFAKDPQAKASHVTPYLCWVCAHLYEAAARQCAHCDLPHREPHYST